MLTALPIQGQQLTFLLCTCQNLLELRVDAQLIQFCIVLCILCRNMNY